MTLRHIQQIGTGVKRALKLNEVSPAPVPTIGEFGVQKLYEIFAEDVVVMSYLPDPKDARKIPKTFIWNVLFSLRTEYLQ